MTSVPNFCSHFYRSSKIPKKIMAEIVRVFLVRAHSPCLSLFFLEVKIPYLKFCVLWTSRFEFGDYALGGGTPPTNSEFFPLYHGSKRSWNCKVSEFVNQAR